MEVRQSLEYTVADALHPSHAMYGDTLEIYMAQWKYDTPLEIILRRRGSDVLDVW